MAKVDLAAYSIEELSSLIDEATKARSAKVAEKRAILEKQLRELEAIDGKPPVKSASGGKRDIGKRKLFRSKKDPSLEWRQYGTNPKWLEEEIAGSGLKRDDFLVKE